MKVERFNKNYNTEAIDNFIMQNKETLETEIYETLQINNIELAVNKMNKFIRDRHNCSKQPKRTLVLKIILKQWSLQIKSLMNNVFLFSGNFHVINQKLKEYQLASKAVTRDCFMKRKSKMALKYCR